MEFSQAIKCFLTALLTFPIATLMSFLHIANNDESKVLNKFLIYFWLAVSFFSLASIIAFAYVSIWIA